MSALGQWQPIETAPTDGREILAYSEPGATGVMLVRHIAMCDFLIEEEIAEFVRDGATEAMLEDPDWFYADFLQGARLSPDCYPTHWMPLPSELGASVEPQPDAASLQSQLDAANDGAWRYEDQLSAALKSLQEIADMSVPDQPAALAHYSEADYVRRHVGIMRHLAGTAVKKIVADEGAKPKPADLTAELTTVLQKLVDEFGCTIEQYHKLGPDWTMKDGTETFNVSAVLDREELIEEARVALIKAGAQ